MRTTRQLSIRLVLLAWMLAGGNAAPAAGALRSRLDGAVDDAARAVMRQYDIPGLAIALTSTASGVLQLRGRVQGHEARGHERHPVRDRLGQQDVHGNAGRRGGGGGRLSLHDSPGRHLPELGAAASTT
jgi:hypothetical protein